MKNIRFEAPEYQVDGSFLQREFEFSGGEETGWRIQREGQQWLGLPVGYQLLETRACGICSTDLARRFLPFRLPQITGHEVIAQDDQGQRCCVEINASHSTRMQGVDSCPFCSRDLGNHCPERLVLGIHDLPGGFSPYILAPVGAVRRVSDQVPDSTAVLVEPLAAALHAVDTVALRKDDEVAVLGPRRLGMLVIAALRARREELGTKWRIIALSRRQNLLDLASWMGADEVMLVHGNGENIPGQVFDVLIDTTGSSPALEQAMRMTRRELHVKSTHGQPAGGLNHLTELVVDELKLRKWDPEAVSSTRPGSPSAVAWLVPSSPPLDEGSEVFQGDNAEELLRDIESNAGPGDLPRARCAVVASALDVDSVIRPLREREVSLVEPRGTIFIDSANLSDDESSPVLREIVRRGLVVSTSRCGDFLKALRLLENDSRLQQIGREFISQVLPPSRIEEAFRKAASAGFVKLVVTHEKEGSDLAGL